MEVGHLREHHRDLNLSGHPFSPGIYNHRKQPIHANTPSMTTSEMTTSISLLSITFAAKKVYSYVWKNRVIMLTRIPSLQCRSYLTNGHIHMQSALRQNKQDLLAFATLANWMLYFDSRGQALEIQSLLFEKYVLDRWSAKYKHGEFVY